MGGLPTSPRMVRPSVRSTMIMTTMVSIISSTDTDAMVGVRRIVRHARGSGSAAWISPARSGTATTETSFDRGDEGEDEGRDHARADIGRTMVKKVLTGWDPSEIAASSIEKSNDANAAEITRIT